MLSLLKRCVPCVILSSILVVQPSAVVAAPNAEALQALGEVRALSEKVNSFRANLEIRDKQGANEEITTSALSVSKEQGWHIRSSSNGSNYEFICDFTNFYQYYPGEKKAFKHTPTAEMQPMLRKPVTDLNPLNLLDVNTVKYKGRGEIAGEPVYHFEGTTSTQFLPQGKPVERKMEAWISAKDGLPRKTIESVEAATGTTIYSNVELNPTIPADEFKFTPPAGVAVVDATAQMRAMEEQERKRAAAGQSGEPGSTPSAATPPAGAPAPTAAATPAAGSPAPTAATTTPATTPAASADEKPKD